jgi:hypothetical protein
MPWVGDVGAFGAAAAAPPPPPEKLLTALTARGNLRTRDGEKEKAALKWKARELKFRAATPSPRR